MRGFLRRWVLTPFGVVAGIAAVGYALAGRYGMAAAYSAPMVLLLLSPLFTGRRR